MPFLTYMDLQNKRVHVCQCAMKETLEKQDPQGPRLLSDKAVRILNQGGHLALPFI